MLRFISGFLNLYQYRYKEILRSTQGIKEKLLARNSSVKELSKGVKREVSAGIAGVARMIDRLDLTSKRNAASVSIFSCSGGTSNSLKGKNVVQESAIADGSDKIDRICTASPSQVSPTVPTSVKVSLAQVLNFMSYTILNTNQYRATFRFNTINDFAYVFDILVHLVYENLLNLYI